MSELLGHYFGRYACRQGKRRSRVAKIIEPNVCQPSLSWHKISVRLLDSFPSGARDRRSLHTIRVSAMVYFSLFGIHEEIPIKQTARLLQ
jgi:hypothetical protein